MWGPIPNSSAPTVISIVISLGKQGTVSPLCTRPSRKKVTIGQNEQNVCVRQNFYACQKPYNIGSDRKNSWTFQPVIFSPYIILQRRQWMFSSHKTGTTGRVCWAKSLVNCSRLRSDTLQLTFSLLRQRGRQCGLLGGTGRIMSSGALMLRTTGRLLANPRSRRIRANVPSLFPNMRATIGTRRSSSSRLGCPCQ